MKKEAIYSKIIFKIRALITIILYTTVIILYITTTISLRKT